MKDNYQSLKQVTKWALILELLLCLVLFMAFVVPKIAKAEELWLISAYDACMKCCGKTDGITASGKHVEYGYIACNWLKFGTKVHIKGLGIFTVQDRGAKSLFGSKTNHIKHIDVYLPTHQQARQFGVKYLKVTIL